MLPTDLSLNIISSQMVDRSGADRVLEYEGQEDYHFFLNLEGVSSAECSFSEKTLTLEKYHLIGWGPSDRVKIFLPHRMKYIYVQYGMVQEQAHLPLNNYLDFNNRPDPRLFLGHAQELLHEFLLLPDARGQGKYHKSMATIRLLKIIGLLGGYFWSSKEEVGYRDSSNQSILDTPKKEHSQERDQTRRNFIKAVDYLFSNFKNSSTTNLSEYLGISKPNTISLIKECAGKLPKSLIEDIKFSIASRELTQMAKIDIQIKFERSPKWMLEEISKFVGVTSNTLNSMFKKETGMTVLDFYVDRKEKIKGYQQNPQ